MTPPKNQLVWDLRFWLALVLVGVVFYLLFRPRVDTIYEDKITTEVITKTDTVYRYVHTSTIKTVPIYVGDTTILNEEYKEFESSVKDSLIEGMIRTVSSGTVISQDFTYKAKIPEIIRTTEMVVTKETKVFTREKMLFVGVDKGLTDRSLSGTFTMKTKKDNLFQYRYDFIHDVHAVGIAFRINVRKKTP